jgi:hypothetical protein
MPTSLATFRAEVTESILNFIVDHWRRLSAPVVGGDTSALVIDPEVLIALTSSLGRHDSRVFDLMVDWLIVNGGWINVQRLTRLVREDDYADSAALGAVAALLAARDRSGKWRRLATALRPASLPKPAPLFHRAAGPAHARQVDELFAAYGLERSPFVFRSHAGAVRLRHPGSIFCTSRAVFGVAIRADVMAYLVINQSAHARGLAAGLGYNHMQVRAVLQAIEQAGIAVSHSEGRTRQYSIDADIWFPVLVGKPAAVEWVNWRRLARGLHGIVSHLFGIAVDRVDSTLAPSIIRETIDAATGDLLQAHPWLSHPGGRARMLGEPLARLLEHAVREPIAGRSQAQPRRSPVRRSKTAATGRRPADR